MHLEKSVLTLNPVGRLLEMKVSVVRQVVVLVCGLWLLGFGSMPSLGEEGSSSQSSDNKRVVVEEYLSLTCPHCASFHRGVYSQLERGVLQDERVVFVYRDFPLNRLALQAAVLARCGGLPLRDKIIGAMLDRQREWLGDADPLAKLVAVLQLVGIDHARAQACLADKALERAVLEEQLAGQKRYRVSSTPTLIVDGKKLSGALKEKSVVRAIQKALNAEGS